MSKIINPNACGIDVASNEHYVAVYSHEQDQIEVRSFNSFTVDLHLIATWLQSCNVETIAMESTGVYWYHLYTILLDYGFEVKLVNAYHVKNVAGRKSDVSDAAWLQQLHSFGLLNGCFQPDNLTRTLRSFVRQRKQLVKEMTTQTNRMLKSFELMNIKLGKVIRDIHGKTGTAIINDILQGERDPKKLILNRDPGIKSSEEDMLKALEGNWRVEQIFNLRQAYEHYLFLKKQLDECDQQSEMVMIQMHNTKVPCKEVTKFRRQKNQPKFNVEQYLYNALGVEVTQIYGIKATVAMTILSETGTNLKAKFPTEKQFLSWLNVVPDNKISGGKVLSSKVKRKKNKAGQAFKDAATTLWRAQNPLGDYIRRKKAKVGGRQAVIATARKIATIYYKVVTQKEEFDPDKLKVMSQQQMVKKAIYLEKKLEEINDLMRQTQTSVQSVI